MGILSWIVIGLIIGFIGAAISKRQGYRRIGMLGAGIFGAAIGGLNVAFLYHVPGSFQGINTLGMLAALVGAVFAVALLGLLTPQKVSAI